MDNTKIFIIHAEVDVELAKKIQSLFGKVINSTNLYKDVFLSSESISIGEDWFKTIKDALKEAEIGVALITPNSRFRPWVYFESGGIQLAFKDKKFFMLLCNGIDESALPDLFKQMRLQVKNISSSDDENKQKAKESLKDLLNTIKSKFNSSIDIHFLDNEMNKVLKLSEGKDGWGKVTQGLRSSRIEGSPIQFSRLLQSAKKEIFIAGQNLHFLGKEKDSEINKLIFEKLNNNKKFKIRILICDINYKPFIDSWTLVTDKSFEEHLETVTTNFKKWQKKADNSNLNLEIRVTHIVPVSIIFADHEDKYTGILVVTPNAYEKRPGPRPSFIILRNEFDCSFDHYWDNYEFIWNKAKPINQ